MLVEDHADTREMYAHMLCASGFEVIAIADGDAALAQASARVPSVVVTDLRMPGRVSAAELCRDFSARGVPVIALTAAASPREHDAIRQAGCASVLVKPLPPDELIAEIRRVTPGSALPQ